MKFIKRSTGVILEPKADMVVEQLQKNPDFVSYEGQNAAHGSAQTSPHAAVDDPGPDDNASKTEG